MSITVKPVNTNAFLEPAVCFLNFSFFQTKGSNMKKAMHIRIYPIHDRINTN